MTKKDLRNLFNDYAVTIKKNEDGNAVVIVRIGYWNAPDNYMKATSDKCREVEKIITESGVCKQYTYGTKNDHGYMFSSYTMTTNVKI